MGKATNRRDTRTSLDRPFPYYFRTGAQNKKPASRRPLFYFAFLVGGTSFELVTPAV